MKNLERGGVKSRALFTTSVLLVAAFWVIFLDEQSRPEICGNWKTILVIAMLATATATTVLCFRMKTPRWLRWMEF